MYSMLYTLLIVSFRTTLTLSHKLPTISPRDRHPFPAYLNITVWSEPGCNETDGTKVTVLNENTLSYSAMWAVGLTTQSYMLSREMYSWERLDWSTPYPSGSVPAGGGIPEACGTYQQTTNPDSNNNVLHGEMCYALQPGATVGVPFIPNGRVCFAVMTDISGLVRECLEYRVSSCL